jgi:hypothetical protein
MKDSSLRAVYAVIAANLALFVAVVSIPAFKSAHHHWIFPALAGLLAAQWAGAALIEKSRAVDAGVARAALLSTLLFVLVMGVVRHATILACFDRCAFKLALASALAAPVFLLQWRRGPAGWWTSRRLSLAGLGAALWALYLALTGLRVAWWAGDMTFAALAAALWLGRRRADFLLASLGVVAGILVRESAGEILRISLGVVWGVAVPLWAVDRVQARLDRPPAPPTALSRALSTAAKTLLFAALAVYAIGPVFLTTDRAQRMKKLAAIPVDAPRDPKTLSPLATRLRGHVVALAGDIGERDAYARDKQLRARDYIHAQFRRMGYAPENREYPARWIPGVKNGTPFYNVEAVLALPPADRGAAWVVGAHYDTAAGTPGADDDTSGVAVLLEAARLLKGRRPARDIRFVAFGTEEPPSFGTRNMGSAHYAHFLKENGVPVHGMISLEMLGYYNSRPGSQLYPPFLHLFYPDRGDYVSVVADAKSRRLLSAFLRDWRAKSGFPLHGAVLPGVFSGLALSDQLNFWDLGYPALMLSDTAFYRNPHYHEHTDAPDTLDYEAMARVTEALVEALDPK